MFAVDRWLHKGYVKPALQRAMDRGAVLSGGSAGAICWFGSGHSDSCDPKSYVDAKLESREYKFYNDEQYDDLLICPSPLSLEEQENNDGDWNYIQIPGIGFLPGLLTPHHDSVQSNGVLRSNDLDRMLLQIAGAVLEHSDKNKKTKQALISQITGIGIDNYAALSVDGDSYSVYGLPGQKGSVGYDYYNDGKPTWSVTDDGNRTGVPGIWIKHVVPKNSTVDLNDINNYKVQYDLLPAKGKLLELYGYDYDEGDGTYSYEVSVDEDVGSIEISRTIDLMNGIMNPLNELSENMKYVDSINKEVQDELGRCRAENPSFC